MPRSPAQTANDRQKQKEFIKKAVEWLQNYPSTQEILDTVYDDCDDVEIAEQLAAYLQVQIKEMPNEA